jgi:hypothetical protein
MTQTDSLYVVAKRIQTILEEPDLPFKKVFYGDQAIVEETPAVAVLPIRRTSDQNSTGFRMEYNFFVDLLIFHSSLQDSDVTQEEADQLGEEVWIKLDQNRRLSYNGDEIVVDGYVRTIEPGFALRARRLMRSSRLSWQGITKLDRRTA